MMDTKFKPQLLLGQDVHTLKGKVCLIYQQTAEAHLSSCKDDIGISGTELDVKNDNLWQAPDDDCSHCCFQNNVCFSSSAGSLMAHCKYAQGSKFMTTQLCEERGLDVCANLKKSSDLRCSSQMRQR